MAVGAYRPRRISGITGGSVSRGLLMFRRFAWLLLCLPMPAQAAAPSPIQSYDSYKSWLVACNNTLTCLAKGFEDSDKRAEMVIVRGAGAHGALTLRISAETDFALTDIRIDGQAAGLKSSDWDIRDDGSNETSFSAKAPAVVRALLSRLRNGARLTLGESGDVPLNGLTAALLRIDERQGRIGGVTALIRTGAAPAASVPEPPAEPFIPKHPIKAILAPAEDSRLIAGVRSSRSAIFKKEECEDSAQSMEAGAWALDQGRALVLIPCGMGAYQGYSLAFIVPRKGGEPAEQVVLALPYLGNNQADSTMGSLTEPDFDPATGTLSMHSKGRGLGDCGVTATWIWDGSSFRLSSLSFQDACGGVQAGDWPELFVSRQ
jgi:hypothetical protein